jgi:hypothetical protein
VPTSYTAATTAPAGGASLGGGAAASQPAVLVLVSPLGGRKGPAARCSSQLLVQNAHAFGHFGGLPRHAGNGLQTPGQSFQRKYAQAAAPAWLQRPPGRFAA